MESDTVAVILICVMELSTLAEYLSVSLENAGESVPELKERSDKSAFDEGGRVTVTVYVFVVPSAAVTKTATVLLPTLSVTYCLVEPLIFTAASVSCAVAVIYSFDTELSTLAEYSSVSLEKAGESEPELKERFDRSAFDEGRRVTVTVYVFVVPSAAVTATATVLLPTKSGTHPCVELAIKTLAVGSDAVAVMFICVTELSTLAEYLAVSLEKAGESEPEFKERFDKSAFDEARRVTVTVYVFVVPSAAVTEMVTVLLPTESGTF